MIYAMLGHKARFAREVLRPLLVRGLRPLGPTRGEIAECIRSRRRKWLSYARALKRLGDEVTRAP